MRSYHRVNRRRITFPNRCISISMISAIILRNSLSEDTIRAFIVVCWISHEHWSEFCYLPTIAYSRLMCLERKGIYICDVICTTRTTDVFRFKCVFWTTGSTQCTTDKKQGRNHDDRNEELNKKIHVDTAMKTFKNLNAWNATERVEPKKMYRCFFLISVKCM